MAVILDFRSEVLSYFDLSVTPMLPNKFQVNWPLGSGEKAEKRFSRCRHGNQHGFPIRRSLASFDLQVALTLPAKFQVNWPFGSGEEVKNSFSRWRPTWISDRNDFSYF